MQAIRDYSSGSKATPKLFSNSSVNKVSANDLEGAQVYLVRISQLLEHESYSELDSEARQVRAGKDRLAGGGWKLNTFYAALATPSSESYSEPPDWESHIKILKKWVEKDPQSAAARVALANAYMGWGAEARGSGYANTVSREGWDLFKKRVELAKATLVEAARLKEKCPGWFFVMQNVSRGESWSKSDEQELFDRLLPSSPVTIIFTRTTHNSCFPNGTAWMAKRKPS